MRLEDVEGLSSPATLSRLFQKRSHKSATDVVVSVGGNEDKRCDSNRFVRFLHMFNYGYYRIVNV